MSASSNCWSSLTGEPALAPEPAPGAAPCRLRKGRSPDLLPPRHLRSSPANIFCCSAIGLGGGALCRDPCPLKSGGPTVAASVSPGRPRNWKFSTTTVSLLRLPPPSRSSQVSNFSLPSTKIGLPLVQYWLMVSAWRPNAVQSTNATSSLSSPLAVL